MATGDDGDDDNDVDGATGNKVDDDGDDDDYGDGRQRRDGATGDGVTGYEVDDDGDDDDYGDGRRRRGWTTTMAMTKRSIPRVMGRRSFTDSHLKDLHAVFIQNEMVPLA